VIVRVGKTLVVLSLVVMLGAHWALLQTFAWTTMLADNLCTHSVKEAVMDTFDGKHPCPICMAIAAGKKSEQKKAFTVQTKKLEFPPMAENFVPIAPSQFKFLPLENFSANTFAQKPLLPPPRGFFV
jgi:hypothetical protein